jgi:hypothetical protein
MKSSGFILGLILIVFGVSFAVSGAFFPLEVSGAGGSNIAVHSGDTLLLSNWIGHFSVQFSSPMSLVFVDVWRGCSISYKDIQNQAHTSDALALVTETMYQLMNGSRYVSSLFVFTINFNDQSPYGFNIVGTNNAYSNLQLLSWTNNFDVILNPRLATNGWAPAIAFKVSVSSDAGNNQVDQSGDAQTVVSNPPTSVPNVTDPNATPPLPSSSSSPTPNNSLLGSNVVTNTIDTATSVLASAAAGVQTGIGLIQLIIGIFSVLVGVGVAFYCGWRRKLSIFKV